MKFLKDNNNCIVAIKLNDFEFLVLRSPMKFIQTKETIVVSAGGGFYKIKNEDIEEDTKYPQSDFDLPFFGEKPVSMRIINGPEAILLYIRHATTFIAENVICI